MSFSSNECVDDLQMRDTGVSLGITTHKKHPIGMLRPPVTQCVPMSHREVGSRMSALVLHLPSCLLQLRGKQPVAAIDGFSYLRAGQGTILGSNRLRYVFSSPWITQ